jgi:hypothetical protein
MKYPLCSEKSIFAIYPYQQDILLPTGTFKEIYFIGIYGEQESFN